MSDPASPSESNLMARTSRAEEVRAHNAKDPVCGMMVDVPTSKHRADYRGAEFHFCSSGCKTKFTADPAHYVADGRGASVKSAPKPADASALFTCPMHPDVRRVGPGSCPICGMALEPLIASPEAGPNPELADMTRRFWIALVFALPVVVVEMGGHWLGLHRVVPTYLWPWIELALATPATLWAGWPFFVRGWRSLATRHLNMFTLIAMGTGVAWAYSVAATLSPGWFPPAFRDSSGGVALYFEAAAAITVFALLGQVLELRARARTSAAIRALLDLAPKTAWRLNGEGEEQVALGLVALGDRLRVRPGEKLPVDGSVLEGRSTIDESLVTGESMPVTKETGDGVIGGTLNQSGALVIRADRIGADAMLARIVDMVAKAQRSRAPVQRLADQVAGWFVPAVVGAALLAFASWATFGPEPRFAYGLVAAIAVLIVACPCALGLATPMSIMVGIGRGAALGILVRDAAALERLEKVDTLLVDKTGTLTEGRPSVTAIVPAEWFAEGEMLRLAGSVERASEHPLARAVADAAQSKRLALAPVREFHASIGKGASGLVEGRRVAVGNAAFLAEHDVDVASLAARAGEMRRDGATVVFVGVDGRLSGFLAIADPIKATTSGALAALRAQGVRVAMLTGDNRATAEAVARQLGIEQVEADVGPEGKGAFVEKLKREGRIVAMAGDGVNDAPALAAADVGIAMGTGADVALESAGVTLIKGDLMGVVRARRLSAATMANIRQNLFFAFLYNAAGVPIAAGILYPLLGIVVSPVVASAAMALSSVSVIGNALRLRARAL
jgi:Cu+-exporting ATPase